jgi:tetratricopeptide (TPR) repeat protein
MRESQFFENPDYLKYIRLLWELHAAIREGKDESEEGEAIRDQMDDPGGRLSPAEIDSVNGISADFYSLTDQPAALVRPRTEDVQRDLAEAMSARASRNFNWTLEVLRSRSGFLEPAALAFQRGRTWMEANEYKIAVLFLQRASELEPANPNFHALALHALAYAEPDAARHQAEKILEAPDGYSPRIVLIACQIRFLSARESPSTDAPKLLESLIPQIRNAMIRMIVSGEAQSLSNLFSQSFVLLGFCFERLGNTADALSWYEQGLTLDPNNVSLLIARGILRYGDDTIAAVKDFERAIQRGSTLVWPYYFLSHDALLKGHFRECHDLSSEGLRRQAVQKVQADMYEWIAISNASLGAPRQVVEASFQTAIRLAPANRRILENYQLYESSYSTSIIWQKDLPDQVCRFVREEFQGTSQIAA